MIGKGRALHDLHPCGQGKSFTPDAGWAHPALRSVQSIVYAPFSRRRRTVFASLQGLLSLVRKSVGAGLLSILPPRPSPVKSLFLEFLMILAGFERGGSACGVLADIQGGRRFFAKIAIFL